MDLVSEPDVMDGIPEVSDGHDFIVTAHDLNFLGVSLSALAACVEKRLPLGLNEDDFDYLVSALASALTMDGVDLGDVDVRLKGSSATFFSGAHKKFPATHDEIVDLFRDCRKRRPQDLELKRIERLLWEEWLPPGERQVPARRPFDSMYVLSIDRVRSDYDLQLSSDTMVERVRTLAGQSYEEIQEKTLNNETYGFVKKDLVQEEFRNLLFFEGLASDVLQRTVSIALFSGNGPPNKMHTHPELSSHHRDTDWKLRLGAE